MNKKVIELKKKTHNLKQDGMQFLGIKIINFTTYSNYYILKESFKVSLPEYLQNLPLFSIEFHRQCPAFEIILTQVPNECSHTSLFPPLSIKFYPSLKLRLRDHF